MNAVDGLAVLAETTIAGSVAIALVLLLRRPLRCGFGAGVGYAAWALVPVASLAVLLPAMTAPPVAVPAGSVVATVSAVASTPAQGPGLPVWLLAAWLLGVVATAMWLMAQQRAFRRGLGLLERRADGSHRASVAAGLPAVMGLWRPTVVLPADFEARYSPEQQALLLTHERIHVARGDLAVNAVVAALRCLYWFNPLLHWAVACFRHDQELACDQRVLALHPQSRRSYGEAMFNTQLAAQPLPLGCHWGFGHPLKERIEMLSKPVVSRTTSRTRWWAGVASITLLAASTGLAAWAAQPRQAEVDAGSASDQTSHVDVASRSMNPPRYPEAAVEQRISGRVVLLVDVGADGSPTAIEVESAEPEGVFEENAVAAAWKWKFEPAVEDGKPVPSRIRVPVDFRMDGPPPETTPALAPPKYPAAAVEERISGRVVLLVDIDENGHPTQVEVERSQPAGVFDAAAVEAARQWKFAPAVEDGQRVPGRVRVPVDFEIPPDADGAAAGNAVYMRAVKSAG